MRIYAILTRLPESLKTLSIKINVFLDTPYKLPVERGNHEKIIKKIVLR